MAANIQPVSERSDVTYGERGMSLMDSFRTSLVGRTIKKNIPQQESLDILDLGCGYHATYLRALYSKLHRGVGIDFHVSSASKELPRLSFVEESIETALPALGRDQSTSSSSSQFWSTSGTHWPHLKLLPRAAKRRSIDPPCAHVARQTHPRILRFSLGPSPAHEMDDHKMYYGKRELWRFW